MLIDECLSPELVGIAHESGFEAHHVAHCGLSGAKDAAVFEKVACHLPEQPQSTLRARAK
jgi:predicted nuclease of predicted toxin-antitoxin system